MRLERGILVQLQKQIFKVLLEIRVISLQDELQETVNILWGIFFSPKRSAGALNKFKDSLENNKS